MIQQSKFEKQVWTSHQLVSRQRMQSVDINETHLNPLDETDEVIELVSRLGHLILSVQGDAESNKDESTSTFEGKMTRTLNTTYSKHTISIQCSDTNLD